MLQNALLSISRRINDDNSVTYVGRIINEKYADGYELIKDNSGNYSFTKIKTTGSYTGLLIESDLQFFYKVPLNP